MKRLTVSLFVLVAFTAASYAQQDNDVKAQAARAQIAILNQAIETWALNQGQFPDSLQELLIKTDRSPAILNTADALTDPWGKPFEYDKAGPKNGKVRPDVWTTEPKKGVIGNWQNKPKLDRVRLQYDVNVQLTLGQLAVLTRAIEAFALDHNGRFPDSLKDLTEGATPYVDKAALTDPWGQILQYDLAGQKNAGAPEIWTRTPKDEVVGNWEARPKFDLVKAHIHVNVRTAQAQAGLLTRAVLAYKAQHGKLPLTLDALTEGKKPYLKREALNDPWGKIYRYDPTGPRNEGRTPDIWTETPNNLTIGNWEEAKKAMTPVDLPASRRGWSSTASAPATPAPRECPAPKAR